VGDLLFGEEELGISSERVQTFVPILKSTQHLKYDKIITVENVLAEIRYKKKLESLQICRTN
jgi:hypothetical protein